jgi:hypothetical protein
MIRKCLLPTLWSQFVLVLVVVLIIHPATVDAAATNLPIYGDSLAAGWADWSWNTTRDPANPAPVHGGSASLSVRHTQGWAGLFLHADPAVDLAGYTHLRFWIHGGSTGGQRIRIVADGDGDNAYAVTAPANTWQQVAIPLAELGTSTSLNDLYWQDVTGNAQATYYLDDVELVAGTAPSPTPAPPASGITLTVDAAASRHAISPDIYGMNFADATLADDLDLPVNRWGGNATTRYNYLTDISNHASDWYFENIKQSNATDLPADSAANRFIEQNQARNTTPLLTLPMSGYVANGVDRACGFSVRKYGAQMSTDPWQPDCGNGMRPGGARVTGNNPLDASLAAPPAFVAEWVRFLKNRYGPAANGGVRFYNLDNEPDLWFETHRDVAPVGWKYQEFRDRTYAYAAAAKAADPGAQLLGPALMGWTYYFYSPYDGQRQDWSSPDDKLANGNVDFVPWYLQQMKAYEDAHGVRLLDYLDLHYYPQAPAVALAGAGSSATQALRLRSTRSLWDPTYVDESWIRDAGPDGGIVRLIPRMKAWVAANYPGTKLAVTEYNWGALDHINGALAQADVLGIFGREGLDLATLWAPPGADAPGAFAFRMYRNYDSQGSKFGETAVHAASSDPAKLAIYAAERAADGALTLMTINKSGGPISATLTLAGFNAGPAAQVYQYSSADLVQIRRLEDMAMAGNSAATTFAANAITLLIVPAGAKPDPAPIPTGPAVFVPYVRR